jgi:hypothetical protein
MSEYQVNGALGAADQQYPRSHDLDDPPPPYSPRPPRPLPSPPKANSGQLPHRFSTIGVGLDYLQTQRTPALPSSASGSGSAAEQPKSGRESENPGIKGTPCPSKAPHPNPTSRRHSSQPVLELDPEDDTPLASLRARTRLVIELNTIANDLEDLFGDRPGVADAALHAIGSQGVRTGTSPEYRASTVRPVLKAAYFLLEYAIRKQFANKPREAKYPTLSKIAVDHAPHVSFLDALDVFRRAKWEWAALANRRSLASESFWESLISREAQGRVLPRRQSH